MLNDEVITNLIKGDVLFVTRDDLEDFIVEALKANGGSAPLIDVCKYVWSNHEQDIRLAGDLFYTWQYDIRWAATRLRKSGIMKAAQKDNSGDWELNK